VAKCPECGSKVKIPSSSDRQFAATAEAGEIAPEEADQDALNFRVAQDEFEDPVLDGSARSGALQAAKLSSDSSTKAPARAANFLPLDNVQRCRKCGRKADSRGFCSACNYASVSREKNTGTPIENIKIKPAGMQLWLSNVVAEGVPPGVLVIVIHCLFFAFVVAAMLVVCTSTSGLGFVVMFALVLAMAFFYSATAWKTVQFRRDPHTRLAWFQRPIWDAILWYCRKNNWPDAKNQNRVIIDRRQTSLTNQELDKVKNLKSASVLDLEGTMINDKAIRYFYRIDDLQCLVLKETEVSHEAVFRLQQARPKLWIWY
jgi:hypothetical protein